MTWLLTLAGLAGWGMRVTAPVGGASLQVASGLNLSPSVNLGVVVDMRLADGSEHRLAVHLLHAMLAEETQR
jgi:hypothetical protein